MQNAAAATLTLASLLLHRHLPPTCRFYCLNNESRTKIEIVLPVICFFQDFIFRPLSKLYRYILSTLGLHVPLLVFSQPSVRLKFEPNVPLSRDVQSKNIFTHFNGIAHNTSSLTPPPSSLPKTCSALVCQFERPAYSHPVLACPYLI